MDILKTLLNLKIIDQDTYNILLSQTNSTDYKMSVEQRIQDLFVTYFGLQLQSLNDGFEALEEVDSQFIVEEIKDISTEKLLFTLKSDLDTFQKINERVRNYVNDLYADEWIPVIDYTTRERLKPIYYSWVRGELGNRGFSDLVRETSTIFGPVRGKSIAVTETTRIFGAVADQTAQETKRDLVWQTANDDFVSEICKGLDGLTVPYNKSKEFKHRETGIIYDVPAHVNCRCEKVIV